MGRKRRLKKEKRLSGIYKMAREDGQLEYVYDAKGNRKAVNLSKHMFLGKTYKDPEAKAALKEVAKQYTAFLQQMKNGEIKSVSPEGTDVKGENIESGSGESS